MASWSAAVTSPWRCTGTVNCAACWNPRVRWAPRRRPSEALGLVYGISFAVRHGGRAFVPPQSASAVFRPLEAPRELVADGAEQFRRAFRVVGGGVRRAGVPAQAGNRCRLGQHRLPEGGTGESCRIEA